MLGDVDDQDSRIALGVIQCRFRREAILIRGLMTDEEWAFFEPFVICRGAHSGRRPREARSRRGILDLSHGRAMARSAELPR
jgi:hypothetical protein